MTELEILRAENARLKAENARLNAALDNAYSINARESSMEAENIRHSLKKEFVCLYNDWLEYEFAETNDNNYMSLNAILKKAFRALKRVGIDF